MYQILSESTGFYGRYDKNILVCVFSVHSVGCKLFFPTPIRSLSSTIVPPRHISRWAYAVQCSVPRADGADSWWPIVNSDLDAKGSWNKQEALMPSQKVTFVTSKPALHRHSDDLMRTCFDPHSTDVAVRHGLQTTASTNTARSPRSTVVSVSVLQTWLFVIMYSILM